MHRKLTLFNLIVIAVMLGGLLLAGCKSATPEPTEAPQAPTAEPTQAPEPTKAPEPTEAPEPTAAPEPTEEPAPEAAPILDAAGAYFGAGMKLITAEAVYENLNDGDESNDPLIIDIRKPEDYEIGHVTGAVNLGAGAIFSDETLAALPTDQQIVIYCYTGQTAGQVTAALNMLGYDAYSLKFGMPSWAITTGPRWNDDMSMSYPLDSEATEATGSYELPDPLAADVAGAAAAYFGDGMKLTTAEAVYENLNDGDESNDPFIISICKPEDYQAGHIPGAVNIGAGALFTPDELSLLPTDRQVVAYCYTGQTAGQATAALNMLGYDAYSLKFGSASWAIREGAPRWNDDMSMDYPADTEPHALGGAAAEGNGVLDAAGAYFGAGMKLITADAVYENLNDGDDSNDPLIIDIRKPEDYEAGHVTGAVNLGAGAIFSDETLAALPTDGQIVVYCYTGQTAGQVTAALNMLGYDAYSLKFGMPSWAITTGPRWNDDMSMSYPLDSEATEATGSYELPDPLAADVAGAAEAYFGDGMKLTTAEAVYENLNDGDDSNDPFILSICKPEDYQGGHVPGAVDIGAGGLFTAETLAMVPADRQVVVYCYTGQTAGQATAALNMLGYDAYSLKFGSASWAIREGAPRWNDDMSMNYPVDTEAHELP